MITFCEMKCFRNLHLLQLLLLAIFPLSQCEQNYCGSIRIEQSQNASFLSRMILCKSDNLYFRTSIGLFPISAIDYSSKHVTVSHTSCSSSSHFLSPQDLSAGFPPPSGPNSLLLFNCSDRSSKLPLFPCGNEAYKLGGLCGSAASCLAIEDADKLERSFHPAQMNCTHYTRVFRERKSLETGTRISFDVPDHVPNPCDECDKHDGNCGAGLRCVCHPMKCKDKVITGGAAVKACGSMLVYLVCFLFMMAS